ncbi:MAG: HAMP domain-containing protein, partial [Acidiferrobacter sp.]
MKWFLNFSTRKKLLLGFGLMGAFLGVVVLTAYLGITSVQRSEKRLYRRDFANAVDVMKLRADVNGMRASLLEMSMVPGKAAKKVWEQDVKRRSRDVTAITQRLLARNGGNVGMLRDLRELKTIQAAFAHTRDAVLIPLIYAGKTTQAKALMLGVQQKRYAKIDALARDLDRKARAMAHTGVVQSEGQAAQVLRLFVLVGVFAMLLGLLMAMFLARIIASPLKVVSGIAARVASGDLTHNVHREERTDEIGVLTETFYRMVEGLREMSKEIREGTTVLASSASEILAATTQVASGAAETATSVSETGTTVE